MKTIKILLILSLFIGFLSCKDELPIPHNDTLNITTPEMLRDRLTGKWSEVLPYSVLDTQCVAFSQNDTIYHTYKLYNTVYRSYYKVISKDSILIVRDWGMEIKENQKTTKNKVLLFKDDYMVIEGFTPNDAAVYPPIFNDIELLKLK